MNKIFMEDKEAIEILMSLLKKSRLSAKEREAISSAIGVLSWTALASSRAKARKAKREKNTEWE